MEIGEADKLRLENEELRQRLAAAERQAEAARGQTQGQLSGHLAAADERAGATGPPGKAERLRQENEGPRWQLATATWQAVLDPDVIQQGLDVTPWSQMRSLTELRRAIEPPAVFLAAQRASADVCRDLVELSRQLQELGKDGRFRKDSAAGRRIRADYQDVDARFHQALLKGSQNEMFFALKEPVRQALSYRIHQEWEGARGPGSGVGEPSASRPVRCRWRCGCIEAWPQPSNSASQKLPRRSRAPSSPRSALTRCRWTTESRSSTRSRPLWTLPRRESQPGCGASRQSHRRLDSPPEGA